jgi:uncharacterized tellurite resistance protein B-like protein
MPHVRSLIQSWFGGGDSAQGEPAALRALVDALDRLEPDHARYLAQFAYLLGRVAHADQHVSPEETRTMEALVQREGALPPDQAMLVVSLSRTSHLMFGGTDNFLVARDFVTRATPAQCLALVRCLFAVAAAEGNISIAEEREIQRIARELKVEHGHLVGLRVEFRAHLPGLADRRQE